MTMIMWGEYVSIAIAIAIAGSGYDDNDNYDKYDNDNNDNDNAIDDNDNKEFDLIQLDLGHPPCTLAESHGVRVHAFHYDYNNDDYYDDDNLDHT